MLKVLIGSIFISLFSSNAFAENCMVSDALKNKSCSVENFKARNQRELDDYLLNGKFKDGKLLNLEIGYNIEDKEINIATTCDLKISHERRLTAKQNGICLKASSIRFEGENELIADKKAPIEISAYNSIIIRESLIFTKGDLVISTSNFLPFEGEILISKESHLKASSIHITSKSNLIINSESKLKADDIILNSGNCEINEKNDRDNDDERDHDKSCKKFTPKFSYSGTCKTNPLPTDLKIAMTVSGNNSQSINFSVLGAPNTSVTNWKFDHSFESINSLAKQDFIYPGRHLAQAVVIGSTGYFRKVGQYINVSPTRFNKGQIAIFQFSGSKNAPNKIQAAIDMRNITLTKSSTDPELYFTEIDGDKVGLRNILIPHFQYQGKFTLNILPEISNPDEYINTYFNSILDKISSSNSTNPSVLQVNESIKLLLGEIKLKIYQLSLADRIKFANFLQANITSNPGRIVETKKFPIKSINILDIIMPSAKAANPLLQLIDLASAGNLRQFNSSNIGFDIAAGALVIVSLGSGVLCKPIWCRAAIGTIFLLTTASVVYSQTIEMDNIGDAHLPKPSTLYGEVVGKALSNQITSIRLRGTFIPVDSLPINQSPLVLSAINRAKNDNAYIAKANEYIDSFNSSLNFFGLSSPLGKIPLVTFPQPTVPGFLSPSYITSATIVDPLDGSASIQSHSKKDGSLVIRSDRSQIVKVKMAYTNNDLGIFQNIIVDVPIVVIPKAVISYTKSNLQVYLDSTDPQDQNVSGLTYIWDFGDGQTATTFSKYLSHTYAQDGTYTIGLKVLDSFGNISQTTIVVSVAAPARFTTINYTKQDLRVDLY
ncbi:MAG: PKD domain-containing protein, partial [Bacteriovorax sp.]